MSTTTKNDLSSAVTKEQIFQFIDSYLQEGRMDIDFEISAQDVRRHTQDLADKADAAKAAAAGAQTLASNAIQEAKRASLDAMVAMQNAQKAVETAQRKAGGNFTVEIKRAELPTVKVSNPHKQFALLLSVIATGCHAYLAGPAGSGKTTAAEMVAQSLKLPFFFTGAVATEFQLTGFVDARGHYHTTPFRKWCEEGGVFLWDEIDASDARAMLRFNAALANKVCEFPDGKIIRLHDSCVAIAAANTFGQGADRVYVGRNQLDGASLDRFVFIAWEYDEDLENRIAGNAAWVDRVQQIRRAVESLKIRAVVSPRASIFGAKLLAQGVDQTTVETLCIFKGMDSATIQKIQSALR